VVLQTPTAIEEAQGHQLLKANKNGYDSITVLQHWKTILTAKLYFNAKCDIALASWY